MNYYPVLINSSSKSLKEKQVAQEQYVCSIDMKLFNFTETTNTTMRLFHQ